MTITVRALTPIKHDGDDYLPNDCLEMSSSQAKRLIELGAGEAVETEQPPSDPDKDAPPAGDVPDAGKDGESAKADDNPDADAAPALAVPEPPSPADPNALPKPSGKKAK